jgi:hypothetical protein
MARAPKNPADVFTDLTADLQKIFGSDLISIILYGSGATGEYIPGKSDLNFLVILKDDSVDSLRRGKDVISRWRKRMVNTPLFMTREHINSSLDSYPIEFLDMQANYHLVYGEDLLENLRFQPADIRIQCERELKGKALRLRQAYLESRENPKVMKEIIASSITAFTALFQGLLYLAGKSIPKTKEETVTAVSEQYGLDRATFLQLLAVRSGQTKPSGPEITRLFIRYISEIDGLSDAVDQLTVNQEET